MDLDSDLDSDFAAWADRRDADALTRVFDATAGRLLLLAMHVSGSRATAEDLVQATFLAAMRGSTTWDRRRPVWPWLAAILQNEAHMEWRRQRRRREVGIEAAADTPARAPDPARLAASDEAFAAVVRAIDSLPLPYRQVLRLRLVHGLQQVEIARALELPVGTVRAQVHRGLAQLREALPAGVAIAAGVWLTGEGTVLAQVRARVITEAAAMPAPAVATSLLLTGGFSIMSGKTWGMLAAGVAALFLFVLALGVLPGLGAGAPAHAPGEPAVAELRSRPSTAPADHADPSQRRPADVVAGPVWPLAVTVRTPAGEPIEGATVRVWVAARGIGVENYQEALREDIASGQTAADGTFRCALDEYRKRTVLFRRTNYVFVTATHPRGRSEQRLLDLPRTAEPHAFAVELKLAPVFAEIVGRVVDGNAAPVANARLYWLGSLTDAYYEELYERSGVDGSFRIARDDPERSRGAIMAADPRLGVGVTALPASEHPPAPGATLDLGTIVLAGDAAIRGRVVLGDGSGLGGFPVFVCAIDPAVAKDPGAVVRSFYQEGPQRQPLQMRQGHPVQVQARPTTAADGSFVCAGLDPGGVYAVAVRDARLRMIPVVAHVGGEPVRLVVDRQLLLLDVRDESGQSLPGSHVAAEGFDPDARLPSDRIRPGFPPTGPSIILRFYPTDAQGRRMLLSPFGWVWRIGSFDEIAQADWLRHEAFAGVYRTELSLALRHETRFGSMRLAVVDENGRPFPKYGFYLRCLDRDLERNNRRTVPPEDGMYPDLLAGRWRLTAHMGREVVSFSDGEVRARGSHVQEIVIEDGRTTEVKIEAKPAGLVGFRLRSSRQPEGGKWEELRIQTLPGGTEVPVMFSDLHKEKVDILPRYGLLVVGRPSFPPGKNEFLITAKGYHSARCEVDVAVDKLVEVDVELFAQ